MDTFTLVLLVVLAALSLGGTFGTYWRLSQHLRQLARENKELKERVRRLEALEERLSILEAYLREQRGKEEKEKPTRAPVRPVRVEEEEYINMKIYVLYKQGKSIREIARQLGLSKSSVHRRLKKILEAKTSSKP